MSDTDAAKLLPPDGMRQLEAALSDIKHAANKLENVGVVCGALDRAIEQLTLARAGNVQWNRRPQPAPPEGETEQVAELKAKLAEREAELAKAHDVIAHTLTPTDCFCGDEEVVKAAHASHAARQQQKAKELGDV